MKLDRILSSATSHVESIRISRTGINPLLWIVGLVSPLAMTLCVLLVFFGGDKGVLFAAAFLAIGVIPILIAACAYFMLFCRRPELLETAEYRLKRHAQIIAYEQGKSAEIMEAEPSFARLRSVDGEGDEMGSS